MISSFYGFTIGLMITSVIIFTGGEYVLFSLGYMKCMQKAGEAGWKAWVPFYSDYIMYKIVGLNGGLVAVKIVSTITAWITIVCSMLFMGDTFDLLDDLYEEVNESSYTNTINSIYEKKNRDNNSTRNIYSNTNTSSKELKTKYKSSLNGITGNSIALSVISMFNSLFSIGTFVIGIFFAIKIAKSYGLGGGYIAGMILVPWIFILIIGFGKSEYKGNYVEKNNMA